MCGGCRRRRPRTGHNAVLAKVVEVEESSFRARIPAVRRRAGCSKGDVIESPRCDSLGP